MDIPGSLAVTLNYTSIPSSTMFVHSTVNFSWEVFWGYCEISTVKQDSYNKMEKKKVKINIM